VKGKYQASLCLTGIKKKRKNPSQREKEWGKGAYDCTQKSEREKKVTEEDIPGEYAAQTYPRKKG